MYEFIGDLSESKLIPSKSNLRRLTAQEVSDLVVLNLCALYILWSNSNTQDFAEKYAKRTLAHGSKFEKWQTNGTDLYILLYALSSKEALNKPDASNKFRDNLPLGAPLLVRWLREMSQDKLSDSTHRSLFVKLDFNFKTNNNSIRAIRRLVLDWNDLDREEHKLAMTRLLQFMRARAARGEVVGKLSQMAKVHGLEIEDACNLETGVGCATTGQHQTHEPVRQEPKKGSLWAALGGLATGAAISHAIHKK